LYVINPPAHVLKSLPQPVTSMQSLPVFCSCIKTSLQVLLPVTMLWCLKNHSSYLVTYLLTKLVTS